MGPVVLWITSALGPLSKAYFAFLKLGGQRQHVKIWKCLVFCPTFRQFSSPQPFPFHNHQCGLQDAGAFSSSPPIVTHYYLTTWIKPCFSTKAFWPVCHVVTHPSIFYSPSVGVMASMSRKKNSRIWLDIDYDILYRKVRKNELFWLFLSFPIIIIILGAMLCLELLLCLRRLLWSQPTEPPPTMLALETKEAEKTKGMIDLGTPNFCFFFQPKFWRL